MLSVALGCAVTLSLVFGASLVTKLGRARFRAFAATAGPLELLPAGWRSTVAGAVVGVELVVAIALLGCAGGVIVGLRPGWLQVAGFGGAGCLLVGFTVGIGIALRRGERAPCRCFGAGETPMSLAHVARNLVLIAAAAFGAAGGSSASTLEPPGAVLAVVVGMFAAAVIVNFDHVLALFRDSSVVDGVG